MNTEQERAEFEAWYRLHHGSLDVYGRDASGEYADKQVQGAFNVWQARAALAAQPRRPEISCDLLGKIVDEVFDGAIEDANVIEDIYRVIARETALQSQDREDAAQSAPAGEREAFEAWARRPDNGVGKLDLRLCDIGLYYRRETGTAWDGFKAGAAWQRTQSVGVPEADLSSDERVAALCDLSYRAGLKAGWNYCADGDETGFARSMESARGAVAVLAAHRKQETSHDNQ